MLNDKTAVITGAANGIGLACAERFIQEGAQVMIADVDDAAGQAAAARLDAYYQHCDVGDKRQVQDLMQASVDKFGRIDCVIANAGIVHTADILELSEADFDRVIRVNLKGVFLTGQLAAKVMLTQSPDAHASRGCIINMSSINAILAIPNAAPYVIAKGGVNQWTKCLGIRLADEGIRVNAVGPGSINTAMFRQIADDQAKLNIAMSRTPMQRAGEPDEVAKVAVFLASHYASYMTGQTVYPDGGRLGLNYVVPTQS